MGALQTKLAQLSQETGLSIKSMDDFNKAVNDGKLIYNDVIGKWELAGSAAKELGSNLGDTAGSVRDFDAEVEAAANSGADWGSALADSAEGMRSLGIAIDPVTGKVTQLSTSSTEIATQFKSLGENASLTADELKRIAEAGGTVVDAYRDQYGALVLVGDGYSAFSLSANDAADAQDKSTEAVKAAKDPLKDLSDSQKLAIENAHDMEKTLLELASNERIKAMEFQVNLNIAELESQVKQVEAAFEQIGTFYTENANIIGKLTDGFMAGGTEKDREFFKEQIRIQMEMEQKVVDSQIALNGSITEMNLAYARSLTQETLIKIDSNGLDHSIETFMFEVLKIT